MKIKIFLLISIMPMICFGCLYFNNPQNADSHDSPISAARRLETEPNSGIKRSNINPDILPVLTKYSPPRRRIYYKPVHVETCDKVEDWKNDCNCVISADKVNYICSSSTVTNGKRQSIKLEGRTPPHASVFKASRTFADKDLSGTHMMIRFYVHEGGEQNTWNNIKYIAVYIYGGHGVAGYKLWFPGLPGAHKGWNTWFGTYGNISEYGKNMDWTAVHKIVFKVQLKENGQRAAVTLDKIEFFPKLKKGLFMFRFDDGSISHYNAASYLESKGLRGTFGIIGKHVEESNPCNLSLEQLHRMQDAGHLIANHTYSHLDARLVSISEFVDDVKKMQKWMYKNGFAEGARILIMPYCRWPEGLREALIGIVDFVWIGCDAAGRAHVYPLHEPLVMPISTVIRKEYNDVVFDAEKEGAVGALEYHTIGRPNTSDIPWSEFENTVDIVAAEHDSSNIKVVTPLEILSVDIR